jgi:hypothetical protein
MQVGTAHAFVDHVRHTHGGAVPAHIHAHLDEDGDDAGVLAERAVTFRTHARIGEDLRDGVARGGRLLALVSAAQRLHVV